MNFSGHRLPSGRGAPSVRSNSSAGRTAKDRGGRTNNPVRDLRQKLWPRPHDVPFLSAYAYCVGVSLETMGQAAMMALSSLEANDGAPHAKAE